MRFGLFQSFRNPDRWHREWADLYAEGLRQTALGEQLGYDSVWLTEHHVAPDGYSPSVLTIAGAVATRTTTMTIGTAVLTLPFYHPVRLAEDAATVDVLSGGRFVLGTSAGYRPEEFAAYGLAFERRAALVDEALDILHGCWTQDGFSYEGEFFTVRDVSIRPRPLQQPHPPVFYGGKTPAGERRAERVRGMFGDYAQPRLVWLVVTEDRAEVDRIREHARYVHEVYGEWAGQAADAGARSNWMRDFDRVYHVCSPAAAVELLGDLTTRFGPDHHAILGMALPGLPDEIVERSMHLFASDVRPQLATV